MVGRRLVGHGGRAAVADRAIIKAEDCDCCGPDGDPCPPFDPTLNLFYHQFSALNTPFSPPDPDYTVALENATFTGPFNNPWCFPSETEGSTKAVSVATALNSSGGQYELRSAVPNTADQFTAFRYHGTWSGGGEVPLSTCAGSGFNTVSQQWSLGGILASMTYREYKLNDCNSGQTIHQGELYIRGESFAFGGEEIVLLIPPVGAVTSMQIDYLIFGGFTAFFLNGVQYTHPDAVSLGLSPCNVSTPISQGYIRESIKTVGFGGGGGGTTTPIDTDTPWIETCLGLVTGEFLESTSEP